MRALRSWDSPAGRLVLAVAAVALYAPSLGYGFVSDDHACVLGHPGVTGPLSARALLLRRFWGHAFDDPDGPSTYRPLTTLSYWLDWHMGGGRPWVFHATNLVLYAACVLMADAFLRRVATPLLSPAARWLSVLAFTALTLHADVVPSIAGRAELLATLCALGSLTLVANPTERLRSARLGAFAVLAIGAIVSKESALPVVLLAPFLAWDVGRREGTPRPPEAARRRRELGAVALIATAVVSGYLALRWGRIPLEHGGERHLPDNVARDWAPWLRGSAALQSFSHYLADTLAGSDLCVDYSYAARLPHPGVNARAVVGALTVFALGAIAAHGLRSRRASTALVAGLAASHLVMSGVLVPAIQHYADRVFFLPSLFVVALLAAGFDAALTPRLRTLGAVAALALVSFQATVSLTSASLWRSDDTVNAHAVRACPDNVRMRVREGSMTPSAERAAWDFLVAAAVFRRFPRTDGGPVADGEWEDVPYARRPALLRARLGEGEYRAARVASARLAHGQGRADAAAVLASW